MVGSFVIATFTRSTATPVSETAVASPILVAVTLISLFAAKLPPFTSAYTCWFLVDVPISAKASTTETLMPPMSRPACAVASLVVLPLAITLMFPSDIIFALLK